MDFIQIMASLKLNLLSMIIPNIINKKIITTININNRKYSVYDYYINKLKQFFLIKILR